MSQDRDTFRRSAADIGAGEGPLNEALDDLESIIGPGNADGGGSSGIGNDGKRDPPSASARASDPRPGGEPAPRSRASIPGSTSSRPDTDLADARACNRVAERLANELEIILNARLESAVREALADARREVHEHVAIVLPELLEEILNDGERR